MIDLSFISGSKNLELPGACTHSPGKANPGGKNARGTVKDARGRESLLSNRPKQSLHLTFYILFNKVNKLLFFYQTTSRWISVTYNQNSLD